MNQPEIESMNFDDDLIGKPETDETGIEELLTDVPKPMANYARAINRMINGITKPPAIAPVPFSLQPVKCSFKAQIYNKRDLLSYQTIESMLNDGWRLESKTRVHKQILLIWVKWETDNDETETGNT